LLESLNAQDLWENIFKGLKNRDTVLLYKKGYDALICFKWGNALLISISPTIPTYCADLIIDNPSVHFKNAIAASLFFASGSTRRIEAEFKFESTILAGDSATAETKFRIRS